MTEQPPSDPREPADRLQELSLQEEMKTSYLTYAMSVIIQRALPDARDGLKPSQRRILLAMDDLNLSPRGKFRKCAKIAGDTSGNYHPHGESVIYPTLVRLAQDFNMRYRLIFPQGNFGAIDGSPPAAMRYTEARLDYPAVDLLDDKDQETVDLVPSYDEERMEATVLPGRFPNLLCNGAQGIAVGMATSIPPHNYLEVADGVQALIENPAITVPELMQHIQGPDFPTKGIICGRSGIHRAYSTGRGQIVVRARASIEKTGRDREQIVVTELPFQVNPNNVFDKVKSLVADKTIEGISYVNDETDRKDGLRLVFEVKKGHQADIVLNQLFRFTQLESRISIILLALSGGQPRTFNLKELLEEYRDHRIEVIQRRTRYQKRKAEERLHIVEGLLIAIASIDEVIEVIKKSPSQDEAKVRLVDKFLLTERQAAAILAMRLGRLTGLEVEKLEEEKKELEAAIARFNEILGDVREVHKLILADLDDMRSRYKGARATEISDEELEIEDEALIPDGNFLVTLSHHGYIKRMSPDIYRQQARGGVGVSGAGTKDGDFIERLILADNKDYLMIFTTWGWVHWLKVWRIPELGRNSQGRFIENLINLRDDDGSGRGAEKVASIIPVKEFDDRFLVTISRSGSVKKTPLVDYSRPKKGGIIGAGLKEGDQLVRATLTDGERELMVSTSKGQTLRFQEEKVRSMGRGAAGVIAVKFKTEGDHVVDLVVAKDDAMLLNICSFGYGMRTRMSEYPTKGRGGMGVVNIKGLERNGDVVVSKAIEEGDDVIMMTESGMIVRIPSDDIRLVGRGSQGVRVMRLKEGDRVTSAVVIGPEPDVVDAEVTEGGDNSSAEGGEDGGAPKATGEEAPADTPPADADTDGAGDAPETDEE